MSAPAPKPSGNVHAMLDQLSRQPIETDILATVCVNHLRFMPCRSQDGSHSYSTNPEDIARVTAHQRG
jgi:hypothetical protein